MSSDPCWKDDVHQLSSAWIDGDGADPASTGEASAPAIQEPAAAQYLADLLLMDSLLAHMSDGAAAMQEARIGRVMHALDESDAAPRSRTRLLRWSPLLAVAATILIVVAGSWVQLTRQSLANDVLLAINEVSAEAIDRVYTLSAVRREGGPQGASQGRLYLRGRSGFVLACNEALLGRSADQFWVVVPPRQVFLSSDFHWINAQAAHDEVGLRFMQEVSLEAQQIPLMQLASVAELMRHDYRVTLTRGELGYHPMDILIGQRRGDRPELPASIQLWSDIDSRIIQRAEISWAPDNALILELLPGEPVPDNWYEYRTHCDGEPTIHDMHPTAPRIAPHP